VVFRLPQKPCTFNEDQGSANVITLRLRRTDLEFVSLSQTRAVGNFSGGALNPLGNTHGVQTAPVIPRSLFSLLLTRTCPGNSFAPTEPRIYGFGRNANPQSQAERLSLVRCRRSLRRLNENNGLPSLSTLGPQYTSVLPRTITQNSFRRNDAFSFPSVPTPMKFGVGYPTGRYTLNFRGWFICAAFSVGPDFYSDSTGAINRH